MSRGVKKRAARARLPAAIADDLRRSGLTAADAAAMRLQHLEARELRALTRLWGSRAGYRIPYFGLDGKPVTTFYRVRFLGEPSPAEGKAPRYWQPPKTTPHLYLSPWVRWREVVADPARDLYLVEGEKKAAVGCRTLGLAMAGLGGVWSWGSRRDRLPVLSDLEPFLSGGRRVIIVFDADPVENTAVTGAREALVQAVYRRGAKPLVLSLPLLNGAKTGLDDFLVARGAAAFSELEPEQTGYVRALEALNSELAYVEASHAVYCLGTRALVANPRQLTQLSYAHRTVTAYDRDGQPRERNLAAEWLAWPGRRTHTALAYEPAGPPVTASGALNVWPGWGAEPRRGPVGPFLGLLDHLFRGAAAADRAWFLRWLAYPLQRPGAKLGTACLLFSRQHGTGKSLLGYTVGRIYGENFAVLNAEALHSPFNTWARHRQFVMGEEVTGSERRADNERLKLLVTQEAVTINAKFQPAYELPDRCNYYLTTNHADALNLDAFDRRFFVHEVLSDRLPDADAREYDAWYRTPEAASAMHAYLLGVDLSGFNPKAAAPVTEAKAEMQRLADQPIDYLVRELLEAPDRFLELAGATLSRSLYTARELATLLDPTGGRRVTEQAVAKALRRAGARPLPVTRVASGPARLYAVREQARWARAGHAERVRDHDGGQPDASNLPG